MAYVAPESPQGSRILYCQRGAQRCAVPPNGHVASGHVVASRTASCWRAGASAAHPRPRRACPSASTASPRPRATTPETWHVASRCVERVAARDKVPCTWHGAQHATCGTQRDSCHPTRPRLLRPFAPVSCALSAHQTEPATAAPGLATWTAGAMSCCAGRAMQCTACGTGGTAEELGAALTVGNVGQTWLRPPRSSSRHRR